MATPVDLAEDLTKCGLCYYTAINPKALPCLHTFCLKCLTEWIKSYDHDDGASSSTESTLVIECPTSTCKKTVPLPVDGVDGFPGNNKKEGKIT